MAFRKQINLTGQTGAGTNYPVLLKVGESAGASAPDFYLNSPTTFFPSAKNDPGDVSFLDGAFAPLSSWVEQVTGVTPNRVAWIWVKVTADLGTNQSIYCQYNTGVLAASSGANVFEFFDDFDVPAAAIDAAKYAYAQGTGGAAIADSVLTLTGAGAFRNIITVATFADGREVIARKWPANTANATVGQIGFNSAIRTNKDWDTGGNTEMVWNNAAGTATRVGLGANYTAAYYRMRIRRAGGVGSVLVDDVVKATVAANVKTAAVTAWVGGVYDNATTDKTDWIAVKKYQINEPAFLSAGTESAAPRVTTTGDPYWASVNLLLKGGVPDGSTSIIDFSSKNRGVSSLGATTVSSAQSKFGNASVRLPQSTPLVYASSADFDLNIPAWTWEMFYFEEAGSVGSLVSRRANATANGWVLTTQAVRGLINGAGFENQMVWTLPSLNAWHHIAWVKDGTELRVYIDGTLVATKTGVTSLYDAGGNINFGQADQASENRFKGYLDEVRFTKGYARYTANFTPPAQTFPEGVWQVQGLVVDYTGLPAERIVRAYRRDSGALLVECNSGPGDSLYNTVSLLMHGEGGDNAAVFADNSRLPKAVTAVGTIVTSNACAKVGGSSIRFPGGGTAQYLSVASHADFAFPGDYTVELYAYWLSTTVGEADNLISMVGTNGFSLYWDGGKYAANKLRVSNYGVDNPIDFTWAPALNTWYHIAVARAAGTARLFVDGALLASAAMATSHPAFETRIGGNGTDAASVGTLNGFIDELRVTKGVARYTAAFTPPTQRHPDKFSGALGSYSFYVPSAYELNVICLDDGAGTTENDQILRTIPV